MKNIIIIFAVLFSLNGIAQDTIRTWMDEYYYERESVTIPSIKFELIRPELFEQVKKTYKNWRPGMLVGLYQSVHFPFFEYAHHIKKNDLNVYVLHLGNIDNSSIRLEIDFQIPEGAKMHLEYEKGVMFTFTHEHNYNSTNDANKRGVHIPIPLNDCIIRVELTDEMKLQSSIVIKTICIDLGTNNFCQEKSNSTLKY